MIFYRCCRFFLFSTHDCNDFEKIKQNGWKIDDAFAETNGRVASE
jgi:hypothetical protein